MKAIEKRAAIINSISLKPQFKISEYKGYTFMTHLKDDMKTPCLFILRGSKKIEYFRFNSWADVEKRINEFMMRADAWEVQQEKYKNECLQKKIETLKNLKVGDIFYSSWGCEQTNVDFYKVIDIKGFNLTLVKVQSSLVRGEESFMSGHVLPKPDEIISDPFIKRINKRGDISLNSYSYCSLWDGREMMVSWYG